MAECSQLPSESKPVDLGILFVHGIGDQRQGDTLNACGGPLLEWLKAWFAARRGEVNIQKTALSTTQFESGTPARAYVTLSDRGKAGMGDTNWLLAESWWASEFYPPSFRDLISWLLTSGSWIIISHIAQLWWRRIRRSSFFNKKPQQSRSHFLFLFLTGVPICLSGLSFVFIATVIGVFGFQLTVLALFLASMVPFQKFRGAIKAILVRVQGVLGDSFVFTSSPINRSSVVSRVCRDLEWLEARCERSIVVAHSQGAAVAFQALKTHQSKKLCRFITYGSGLLKLQELDSRKSDKGPWRLIRYAVFLLPLYVLTVPYMYGVVVERMRNLWRAWKLVFTAFEFSSTLLKSPEDLAIMFFLLPLLLLVGVFFVAAVTEERRAAVADDFQKMSFSSDFEWLDLYSTHDPVPNGPLFEDKKFERFRSIQITNRMSSIRDHTTYWENGDEFISLLGGVFLKVCRRSSCTEKDFWEFKNARMHRRHRVNWLLNIRRWMILMVGAPLFLDAKRVQTFGETKVAAITDTLLTSIGGMPSAYWTKLNVPRDRLLDWGWLEILSSGGAQIGYWCLGAIVPIALGVGWYLIIYNLWSSWDEAAIDRLLKKQEASVHLFRRAGLLLVTMLPGHVAIRYALSDDHRQVWSDLVFIGAAFQSAVETFYYWGNRLELVVGSLVAIILVVGAVSTVCAALFKRSRSKNS